MLLQILPHRLGKGSVILPAAWGESNGVFRLMLRRSACGKESAKAKNNLPKSKLIYLSDIFWLTPH